MLQYLFGELLMKGKVMKRKLSIAALLMFALIGLSAALIQADFVQCIALVNCGVGGGNPDIINGSPGNDIIRGFGGGDVILGNDGSTLR